MVGLGRPSRHSLLVLAALAVGLSCSGTPATPTSGTTAPPASPQVSLCHHLQATNSYALTVVTEPEVPPHMAHGDGRVSEPVPEQPDHKFGASCEFVPIVGATIAFDGLENGAVFTSYEAGDLTATVTARAWEVFGNYGNPKPSVVFKRLATEPDSTGEVTITAKTGPFQFVSVDLYSSVTTIPYVIKGLRKGKDAFVLSATIPNTLGKFATVSNSDATMIDTLVIRLTNPATSCCANPMGLDTIVIKR